MIIDVRKLKPGDIIRTENKVSCLIKECHINPIIEIPKDTHLFVVKIYNKPLTKGQIHLCCDVIYEKKHGVILLTSYPESTDLPKDLLDNLYSAFSYSRVL